MKAANLKFVQGWTQLNFVKLLYKGSAVYVLVLCCIVLCIVKRRRNSLRGNVIALHK